MGILTGKAIIVTGIANNHSIAFGVARSMHKHGAKIALTYQNNKLKTKIEKIAQGLNTKIVFPCDVGKYKNIKVLFANIEKIWPKFDGLVHSIAYAPSNQLQGDYVTTITQKGFKIAHNISSYSFVALAKACRHMLNYNSALLTFSFLGSERVIPNYNVMGLAKASLEANVRYMAHSMGPNGIRVNAISCGPIRTNAAYGIKNFRKIISDVKSITPLRRTVTLEEIGNTAAFLCSNLASGITGEIIHVDGGFNKLNIVKED
ncbi:MAG: SDR family oxidoreductase [Candidatus Dasytiphilus stammeri]